MVFEAIDIGLDYAGMDGVEPVTLTIDGAVHAERQVHLAAISEKEAADSGGRYTASDVRVLVPDAELGPGLSLPLGSTITRPRDGAAFVVLSAMRDQVRAVTDCVARLLAFFDRKVRLEHARIAKGAGGAAVRTWEPEAGTVDAAVIEIGAQVADDQLRQGLLVTHRIVFSSPQAIQAGDRVSDQDGSAAYLVRSWEGRDRLGRAMEVLTEQQA